MILDWTPNSLGRSSVLTDSSERPLAFDLQHTFFNLLKCKHYCAVSLQIGYVNFAAAGMEAAQVNLIKLQSEMVLTWADPLKCSVLLYYAWGKKTVGEKRLLGIEIISVSGVRGVIFTQFKCLELHMPNYFPPDQPLVCCCSTQTSSNEFTLIHHSVNYTLVWCILKQGLNVQSGVHSSHAF